MVNKARKAQLEELSLVYLYEQLRGTGIDVSRFTKAELIDMVLKSEGQVPAEPEPEPEVEPPEPEPQPAEVEPEPQPED